VNPAVFLDRDNTLILNDGDLGRPADVRLIHGVPEGLASLRDAGFNLIVVTNQAGVARGVFTEDDVDAVHQRIASMIDDNVHRAGLIDRFYYCPYHPEGTVAEYKRDHLWRKPHPGMILQAARDMEVDLARSWMIGDQERDVKAGQAAGCRTVLVTRDAELAKRAKPNAVAADFAEAVRIILEQDHMAGSSNGDAMVRHAAVARKNVPQNGTQSTEKTEQIDGLRRALNELAEEIRSDRLRRADFTIVRMLAGLCQLFALLLAILGLLQLSNSDVFIKWMVGAGLAQMFTIALLILDLKA
jgi:D-glycero-D-manno-heptose 1,7-bisphosphate phosphatase